MLTSSGASMVISFCRQLPTSLEELLEYQWEQGAQFLMQQASQYDGTVLLHYDLSVSFKDVRAQNVPTYRFFFKLAMQKGYDLNWPKRQKKWGVTVLVFEIMRCTFRSLRYFKTILAYNCQQ